MVRSKENLKKWRNANRDKINQQARERLAKKSTLKSNKLIQHHAKYKEIHGVDEIKLLTISEHRRLHCRLRREKKCNIDSNELKEIAAKAHMRSPQYIKNKLQYLQSDHRKEQNKKNSLRWSKLVKKIEFWETIETNVLFHEILTISPTGNVWYTSVFKLNKSHSDLTCLPVVSI